MVNDVELRVGTVLRQNFSLAAGEVSEQITVTAEAPLMQTESGTVGQVIEHHGLCPPFLMVRPSEYRISD